MLKNKTKIITIFLILIILLGTTLVFAENETNKETNEELEGTALISNDKIETPNQNELTTPDQLIENENYKKSDVYLTGKDITIDYVVDGNVYIFADTVKIKSQISGDAFIFAKNVIVEEQGYIFSNLFTISESVEIKGVVYDIYTLAQNLTISKGYVYRDIKGFCKTLNINGTIGRNVFIQCSNIKFNTDQNNNGIIYGNLNYSSKSEISIPGNVVTGEVNYTKARGQINSVQSIFLNLGNFITTTIIIWILSIWLAQKFIKSTNSYIGIKSLVILGYGLLAFLAIPLICIILILLQITSTFSLLLLLIYCLTIAISSSLLTIIVNNYICSKFGIDKNLGILGMLIISSTVVWGITQIPYIGGIISFVISISGLGLLVNFIIKKIKEKEKEN